MSKLPLGYSWTVPRGDCKYCKGSGRHADGAGSMDDCDDCQGTGSREVQCVVEIYRRGFAAGIEETLKRADRYPLDRFPANVRVLMESHDLRERKDRIDAADKMITEFVKAGYDKTTKEPHA